MSSLSSLPPPPLPAGDGHGLPPPKLPPPHNAASDSCQPKHLTNIRAEGLTPLPPSSSVPPPRHDVKRSFVDVIGASSSSHASISSRPITKYKGFPAISFSPAEVKTLSAPYEFSLVGRFSKSRPPLPVIKQVLERIGFKHSFSVGVLAPSHILLTFSNAEDYQRCFSKRLWQIQGCPMHVFKWSPNFHCDEESPMFPIWISLEHLPVHLHSPVALHAIAKIFGKPLMLDAATSSRSRPSVARFCVELDVSGDLPTKFFLDNGNKGLWQLVHYEQVPQFCTDCRKTGHKAGECQQAKNMTPKPSQDTPQTNAGPLFTWTGKRSNGIISRKLDRFLINPMADNLYSTVHYSILNKTTSDHSPILFKATFQASTKPKSFRFLNLRTSHPSYLVTLKNTWDSIHTGRGMHGLYLKLQATQKSLSYWSKNTYGNFFNNVKLAEEECTKAEEEYEDNPNTCRARWRKQHIHSILNTQGIQVTNEAEILEARTSYFQDLFSPQPTHNMELILHHIPHTITAPQNESLCLLPNREEIKNLVWHLDPNSSAGPDGFNGNLIKYNTGRIQTVNHLTFADDVLIFTNGSLHNLKKLRSFLTSFEEATGLHLNLAKSQIISPKPSSNHARRQANCLGMKVTPLPITYLGVPLYKGINRSKYCQDLLRKFDLKLSSWKMHTLSQAGRLTLIKHLLSTLPLHTMSSSRLPESILSLIEGKLRQFFWGKNAEGSKHAWVAWHQICKPLDEGGLDIPNLRTLQQSFGCKLWWKYQFTSSPWVSFIRQRYHRSGSFTSTIIDSPSWKRICQADDFCTDNSNFINGMPYWELGIQGSFSLKNVALKLQEPGPSMLTAKIPWPKKGIPKANLFLWKTLNKATPFANNLQKLGFNLPSICMFCEQERESDFHCLMLCPKASIIRNNLGQRLHLPRISNSSFQHNLVMWWLSTSPSDHLFHAKRTIQTIIMWELWKTYNRVRLNQEKFKVEKTLEEIKHTLNAWSLATKGTILPTSIHRKPLTSFKLIRFPPNPYQLKLNVDGSASTRGCGGGAVLRDHQGNFLHDGPLKIQMENPERNLANPDVVQYIPKPKEKWDDRDCKKHNLDNIGKAAIFKTLDPITFCKIKHLNTAMEIWLLRSLPTEWYNKATAMEEGRNRENYTVQGLLDELRTYEHELKKKKEEQVTPFPTALMTTPRIPSSEGTCPRNCDTPSSSQPSSSKTENYDEEYAMMVKQFRKFKKFFKKADSVRRPSKGKPQVSDSPPESYLCYNCRKPGHWKSACLYPKVEKYGERERNEKKKKEMVVAESDESSSSSSDEEALVCMERRAEKSNHEDRWTMSEDDTLCLMAKDDADQEAENESLSEKVKSLNKELGILKSKEAVDKLLERTKHKGREGLGFDPASSKRRGRTTFIPPKLTARPNKQKGKEKEKPTEVPKKDMASLKNNSTNEVILTGKRIRNIYEVMWDDVKEACLISKDKDQEVNEEDRMKPTEFIPFGSLPLKTSQRNPDSDGAEPTRNLGQPSNIPDHSHGDNSGNGDRVPIHPESPTTSVLQPEAELDQPTYLEMIAAQELSEFLDMEIHSKYEDEVLEFYRNGKSEEVIKEEEAPHTLAVVNLDEEEEVPAQGELQKKKKRRILSPSTSGSANPDELVGKEPVEEPSAHNEIPQQLDEETPQDQSFPSPPLQAQTDDVESQFMQLYFYWRAWKVGNSAEQLLGWDQQLKNEKIIKKCLGLPVNHCCEQILDVDWSTGQYSQRQQKSRWFSPLKHMLIWKQQQKTSKSFRKTYMPLKRFFLKLSKRMQLLHNKNRTRKHQRKNSFNSSKLKFKRSSQLHVRSPNQLNLRFWRSQQRIAENQKEAFKLFRHFGTYTGKRKLDVIVQHNSPSLIPQLPIEVKKGELTYIPSHLNMTELILEAQQSNPENSTQHLTDSGLDGTEAVGTIASHFSNDAQTKERNNNLRRIKEECGIMQGIGETAGSSKRKKQ
ncbi:unnamed protein product [Cuscuta campestris]|uniref:CCHC-type domain-containing protein n=1 Tax=Cuscuta campestris TaxID=132261 RepID=A0A484M979_9ASTE|nr:unnamed protein product [Cuscuta campestris]